MTSIEKHFEKRERRRRKPTKGGGQKFMNHKFWSFFFMSDIKTEGSWVWLDTRGWLSRSRTIYLKFLQVRYNIGAGVPLPKRWRSLGHRKKTSTGRVSKPRLSVLFPRPFPCEKSVETLARGLEIEGWGLSIQQVILSPEDFLFLGFSLK